MPSRNFENTGHPQNKPKKGNRSFDRIWEKFWGQFGKTSGKFLRNGGKASKKFWKIFRKLHILCKILKIWLYKNFKEIQRNFWGNFEELLNNNSEKAEYKIFRRFHMQGWSKVNRHYLRNMFFRRSTILCMYKGCSKSKVPHFLSFFLGNNEINYWVENVQEVCTNTLKIWRFYVCFPSCFSLVKVKLPGPGAAKFEMCIVIRFLHAEGQLADFEVIFQSFPP